MVKDVNPVRVVWYKMLCSNLELKLSHSGGDRNHLKSLMSQKAITRNGYKYAVWCLKQNMIVWSR